MVSRDSEFWVFAYGSLMWAPDFPVAERVPVELRGWHRRFSLLSSISWGTSECPGLCAALHEGGLCAGFALRIEASEAAGARTRLERREAAYLHIEVPLEIRDGREIQALTFLWNPAEPRFMPDLTVTRAAALIAGSRSGRMGTSADYLRKTIGTLEEAGLETQEEKVLLAALEDQHFR